MSHIVFNIIKDVKPNHLYKPTIINNEPHILNHNHTTKILKVMDPFNGHISTIIMNDVERDEEHMRQIRNRIVQTVTQNPPPSFRIEREPVHTSALTGMNWITELINGHHTRIHNQFRMSSPVFLTLCQLLREQYGLSDTKRFSHVESVAIFLYTCAKGAGFRDVGERFQRPISSISKHFLKVLEILQSFARDQIRANVNAEVHPHIRNNMYYPHFKDCIGGIDGTHVHACVAKEKMIPFIGRKGTTTQNVLGVCDFDLCFTFVSAGWEGSMHDARILGTILRDPNKNFPKPPESKYYLVDSGYSNMRGYLAPYKGERYHLQNFRNGNHPRNPNEIFNKYHASLRSVIERTFGVWKERWHILDRMPFFEMNIQAKIVVATMALHNFIRRTNRTDPIFADHLSTTGRNDQNVGASSSSTEMRADSYMDSMRDEIRHSICGMSD